VAAGPKRGFDIPVYRWLAGPWNAAARESFRDSILDREGWIRASAVDAQLQTAAAAGLAPPQLWYLAVLEAWLKREHCSSPAALELALDIRP
jgi:asparagine synthase (glutamine-hydrolysing)